MESMSYIAAKIWLVFAGLYGTKEQDYKRQGRGNGRQYLKPGAVVESILPVPERYFDETIVYTLLVRSCKGELVQCEGKIDFLLSLGFEYVYEYLDFKDCWFLVDGEKMPWIEMLKCLDHMLTHADKGMALADLRSDGYCDRVRVNVKLIR